MSNQYQDFGDDAESDTGDFNPNTEQSDNEEPKAESVDGDALEPSTAEQRGDAKAQSDDEEKPQQSPVKRRDSVPAVGADEDDEGPGEDITNDLGDDDEEEQEEEEEEEDAEDVGPTRKRRKRTGHQFIDEMAEVDEDDDDLEDEDEEKEADFVADIHPDDEGLDAATERDDRRHRELDMQRQRDMEMDAEQEAERLRKKYGRNAAAAVNSAVTPQSYLVPSVNDPSIWGVKCKLGKEKEIVFSVMKRLQDRMGTREQLEICSAFERGDSIPGFFYVEAYRQAAVIAATDGLPFAYPRSKLTLVPIGEMPDLLRVRKTKTLEPGMYVRIRRGRYQGDLAQVEDVMENGLEVDLRLVPRLEYGAPEDTSSMTGPDALKRKRAAGMAKNTVANRPPPRLFSEMEAGKRNGRHLQQQSTYSSKEFVYFNEKYINGLLHKSFKVQHVQTEDVNPTLEEVSMFKSRTDDGGETLDLQALRATQQAGNTASSYRLGDMVEIFQGEQQGVTGTVSTSHGDIVSLKITDGDLRGQTIEAPANILRKSFQVGRHVTVTGISQYQGESGFVERIKDDRVTLLTDASNKQITVFSKDLREADHSVDMSISQRLKGFDLHDLLQIDNTTVGVVIKTERDAVRVLDQHGNVREVPSSGVQRKIERHKFDRSVDRDGNEVNLDDSVKEIGGLQRQARVLHIWHSHFFLQDRSRHENAGMFVVRSHGIMSTAAQQSRTNGANAARGNGNGAMPPPPTRSSGRDRYIGKTVRVKKGPHKGLLGIVRDASENEVRVEIHTKNKVASVKKELINVIDPQSGQVIDMSRFGGPRSTATFPMRTGMGEPQGSSRVPQWDGGRTPVANGGRTPGWGGADGGRTPAWAAAGAGNKTPAWKQASARTPAPSRNDGSRTAYGGDGGRTSYGGATSYGGVSTFFPL